jgi:hypothetical protein
MRERDILHYDPYESLETKPPENNPRVWEQAYNAFTPRQREAIRKRDHYKCQFPDKHDCGGRHEVHHVLPQGYAKEVGVDPDYPENALTICKNAHEKIHPDSGAARRSWKPKSDVFVRVQEARKEKLAHREIYWNPTWDRQMTVVAVRNTQRARAEGWTFPGEEDLTDPRVERARAKLEIAKKEEVVVYQAKQEGVGD